MKRTQLQIPHFRKLVKDGERIPLLDEKILPQSSSGLRRLAEELEKRSLLEEEKKLHTLAKDTRYKDKELICVGRLEIARMCEQLATLVIDSGFKPNLIVGIATGGLVPARDLKDYLGVPLSTIGIRVYNDAGETLKHPKITEPLRAKFRRGWSVLIVDEIMASGKTLEIAVRHVRKYGASEVKTAVLDYKTSSSSRPDYFVREWGINAWIVYPWVRLERIKKLEAAREKI